MKCRVDSAVGNSRRHWISGSATFESFGTAVGLGPRRRGGGEHETRGVLGIGCGANEREQIGTDKIGAPVMGEVLLPRRSAQNEWRGSAAADAEQGPGQEDLGQRADAARNRDESVRALDDVPQALVEI